MLIASKLVQDIVKAAFPDCKKKQVAINAGETIEFVSNYWSDGYRIKYAMVNLETMDVKIIPTDNPLRAINTNQYPIPAGVVVVALTYSGVHQYVSIICHPSNMPVNLTQTIELTDEEKTVLYYTRAYKSSYAGISNYRYHEYITYGGGTMSETRWAEVKVELYNKKLLTKAGGLTMEGKNAAKDLNMDYATKKIS